MLRPTVSRQSRAEAYCRQSAGTVTPGIGTRGHIFVGCRDHYGVFSFSCTIGSYREPLVQRLHVICALSVQRVNCCVEKGVGLVAGHLTSLAASNL
jgi:hypothetical protein